MNDEERKRLARIALDIRNAGLAKVEANYHATLKAIDLVLQLTSGEEKSGQVQAPTMDLRSRLALVSATKKRGTKKSKGGKAATIRSAIEAMDKFSTPKIDIYIKENFPSSNVPTSAISTTLNKMKAAGLIVRIAEGAGRSAHEYRKANEKLSE